MPAKYEAGAKKIPYQVVDTFSGADMLGIKYEQLLPWATPYQDAEKAFVVIPGDFVTTEDGTGIVHTAPTFGADDAVNDNLGYQSFETFDGLPFLWSAGG